jgi:hypothetical protein
MLWQVATPLLKPFGDIMKIWSRGTKSQPGNVTKFFKLQKVHMANSHMTIVPKII